MRRMSFLLMVLGLVAASSSTARAASERSSADASSSGGSAETSAGIETVSDGAGGGAGGKRRSGSSLECSYYSPIGLGDSGKDVDRNERYGSRRELQEAGLPSYGIICKDENGNEVVNDLRDFEEGGATPEVDPEFLAEQAAARLAVAPPEIQLSPKADLNQIVQLPTWMWVSNWEPASATASVPGVTSTVTATPASVTWDMGNGDQVVCSGPGTPFDSSRPEEEQSTDCSYTYRHSSTSQPSGVYQVSATMTYDVSWSASGAPGGGALPAVSETTTFPLRVLEIHAVEGVGSGDS